MLLMTKNILHYLHDKHLILSIKQCRNILHTQTDRSLEVPDPEVSKVKEGQEGPL